MNDEGVTMADLPIEDAEEAAGSNSEAGLDELTGAADEATVEMPLSEADDPRAVRRVPMWLAVALATVAVLALGVALAALSAARDTRAEFEAFQADIFTSGGAAASTLNATASGLAVLVDQPLIFQARVDQDVPIVASVPFSRSLELPINVTIPIREVIETTITVDGPFGFDVPVNVTVPIDLDLPIDLSVPIDIDEVIEVDTSTRLNLDVPVAVDLEETGLAELVRQMSANLMRLADTIPQPG